MTDSTYTTGRHSMIKWLQNLNAPNSSEQATSKSLDVDIPDVVLIMRALGMKLISFEKSGQVLNTGCGVVIKSKRSGVKYVMEKKTSHCNCKSTTQNSESSSWSVSGIGSKESLPEADSSAFPRLSSGLSQILHNTLIDILYVTREVELRPKKNRHYVMSSGIIDPSPRSSINTGAIRHASSMPVMRFIPATPRKEIYPVSSEFSKMKYPVRFPGTSNEAVFEKFEYIQGEMDALLSDLKLKQLASKKRSEMNSITSQFSEINIPRIDDSVTNPEIDTTEILVNKLEHIKEEMKILRSQLNNIVKQPLFTSPVLYNPATANKKDSECVGKEGIIKRRPSLCSDRLSVTSRSIIATKTSKPAKQEAVGASKRYSEGGNKGAIKKSPSLYQNKPRSATAVRSVLSSVRVPAKQETVAANKDSEGRHKGAIKKTPVFKQKLSSTRSVTRTKTCEK